MTNFHFIVVSFPMVSSSFHIYTFISLLSFHFIDFAVLHSDYMAKLRAEKTQKSDAIIVKDTKTLFKCYFSGRFVAFFETSERNERLYATEKVSKRKKCKMSKETTTSTIDVRERRGP